jgi:hypothetical protein
MTRSLPFVFLFCLAACHNGSATGDGTNTGPAHGAAVGDALPFPAFHPDAPQVVSLGGPVMDSPQAVAITFAEEASVDDIEKFVATIGATDYWDAIAGEYGVRPLVGLPPIRLSEAAPALITDGQIQDWLRDKLDGTHPEFPAPGPNVIYTLFYPATTVIDDGGGQSCDVFGGYHNSTAVLTDGTPIIYAVLPRCVDPHTPELDTLTLAASHELIEASTDPQPLDNPAYLEVDDNHAIYTRLTGGGGEVGDMCAINSNAAFKPSEPSGFAFTVQRSWSNLASLAGRDPCVPAPTDAPYFNSAPRTLPDAIQMTGFGGDLTTEGFTIPVGTSRTIELEIFSTDATDMPVTLKAIDLSAQRTGRAPTLEFSFDRNSGVNGERVRLTITALAASSTRSGVTSFEVRAELGTLSHPWLGVVQAQ